jgi:predicted aspartyl protease
MIFNFKREPDSGVIIVSIFINNTYRFKMILDTGASYTTIDSNMLHLSGYNLTDSVGTVLIETANGIIETEIFEIDTFFALGITQNKFQIQVYDFVAHGITSDYHGLLGLNFFEGTKFCIDTVNNQLSIDLIKKST